MTRPDDAFLEQLRATFRGEAAEHLQVVDEGLATIAASGDAAVRAQRVEAVFRAVHSLKGAARSVDLPRMESLCQLLEEQFAAWKREGGPPSPPALGKARRLLDQLAEALRATGAPERPASVREPEPRRALDGEDTVRISISRLAERLATAEEMLPVKLHASRFAAELQAMSEWFDEWHREWQILEPRVRLARGRTRADEAADPGDGAATVRFLEWNLDRVQRLESRLAALAREADHDRRQVGRLVDELLGESKALLLSPFAAITRGLPRLVDDLSHEQAKQVFLAVRGEDVEIDRRVLQEIKDPLIHALRNAIDHGIEMPEERRAAGKPAQATLSLEIARLDAGKISVRIADDGRGVRGDRVKQAALAQGLISAREAEEMSDADAAELVFRGGLSTSAGITRVSGRGLGLAIVREKVERLGGAVSIASRPGAGAALEMLLPTTLATFRGVLVEAAGLRFVIPGVQVERVARVAPEAQHTVEGREVVRLAGRMVPLARLERVLELAGAGDDAARMLPVVVLGNGDQRVAFAVDEVLEELEVLAKPLYPPLKRVRNVSGATVLASGEIAPILNVADLLKSSRRAASARTPARAATQAAAPAAKHVLVAEDSITSRMLLKGILESAGYAVRTASDGMDALLLLRSHRFDVVISDVDMPRLNGFGLTQRIRADARTASLPVILVTTLDSVEHRERGIDVGASAYIVKSRLDQAELLEAVRRLAGAQRP